MSLKKLYFSCTSRVLVEYCGAQGGQVQARKVMGYIEDLTSSFPLGSALYVMMVLGGLQSQRLGYCVSGKLSG